VGDRRGTLPTQRLTDTEISGIQRAAVTTAQLTEPLSQTPGSRAVLYGDQVVVKVQERPEQTLDTALVFNAVRLMAHIPIPRLLAHGGADQSGVRRWWAVLERLPGTPVATDGVTPARQRALGAALRAWHDRAIPHGRRLDDPGVAGLLLGGVREHEPGIVTALSARLAAHCQGAAMSAVHGDVAVTRNTLYREEELTAILDPSPIQVAPPMLDLAWASALDLAHGADPEPLCAGYGRDGVDEPLLTALTAVMLRRRLAETRAAGDQRASEALRRELTARAPDLLEL
jgi:hypothetical protein